MILLAAAVEAELASWRPREDVEMLVTGIGPIEASCTIATALAGRQYRLVVNAGIAGAFDGAASVGEGVVVVDDTIELDLENGGALTLPAGANIVNRAHSDPALVEGLQSKGFSALHGITVARVTACEATARRLATQRGAQVESMEGFAVLRAAARVGVPAVEVRGISNRCGERRSSGWDFAAGVAGLHRILDALFGLHGMGTEQLQ